eukprot:15108848-Alexandrium_andersonii.AAC.1
MFSKSLSDADEQVGYNSPEEILASRDGAYMEVRVNPGDTKDDDWHALRRSPRCLAEGLRRPTSKRKDNMFE